MFQPRKTSYEGPVLTEYGDVASLTGILGARFTGDILVDVNGNVEQEGNLSIDACPTRDFEHCER